MRIITGITSIDSSTSGSTCVTEVFYVVFLLLRGIIRGCRKRCQCKCRHVSRVRIIMDVQGRLKSRLYVYRYCTMIRYIVLTFFFSTSRSRDCNMYIQRVYIRCRAIVSNRHGNITRCTPTRRNGPDKTCAFEIIHIPAALRFG